MKLPNYPPGGWLAGFFRVFLSGGAANEKLTNTNVLALPIPDGRQTYTYDSALAGFGVRVNPGGRKAYFVQFRFRGEKRRQTLGSTDVLSAEVARAKAREVLAKIALGENPDAQVLTLQAAWEEWTDSVLIHRSASYRKSADVIWRLHIPKRMKLVPVTELRRHDLLGVCEKLVKAGKIPTASLTLSILGAIFSRLLDREVVNRNPLHRAKLEVRPLERDRVLSDAEIRLVWEAGWRLGERKALALHALMITACRRAEILELRWSEVDLDQGVIFIPAERTKTNAPHMITLPKALLERFRKLDRDGELVFGEFNAGAFLERLRNDVKFAEDWRLHDLRRTAATTCGRLGVPPHIVERVLNHNSKVAGNAGVAGVYNRHAYTLEKADALKRYEDWLARLVAGVVVPLRRVGR